MAPKRGGSSSSGGYDDSTTICENCSAPLDLDGSNWQDDWSIPYLILACISLVIYLYAAGLCFKRPIIRHDVKDKWMTRSLRIAVVFAIFACCLDIVEVTLYEDRASLNAAYYIEYIFHSFISTVAEFLLLIPITYMILDHASFESKVSKALRYINSTTLLTILGTSIALIVGFTLFDVTFFADLPNTTEYYYKIALIVNVIYESFYAALTFELLILAGIGFGRSFESLKLRIFWITVTTLLFLRSLFHLIYVVYMYRFPYADGTAAATQPNLFMYQLLGAVCFMLLGLIVKEQQRKYIT